MNRRIFLGAVAAIVAGKSLPVGALPGYSSFAWDSDTPAILNEAVTVCEAYTDGYVWVRYVPSAVGVRGPGEYIPIPPRPEYRLEKRSLEGVK